MLSKNKKIYKKITVVIFLITILTVIFFVSKRVEAVSIGMAAIGSSGLASTNIMNIVAGIIQIFLGLLGLIALTLILYGGFIWMTSGGNEEKITRAKKILVNAVIGLIIILSAFAIVSYFVFNLGNVTNPPIIPGGPGLPPGGAIGGGIIENVYPLPDSQNNARNTLIMVTFKEGVTNIINEDDNLIPPPPPNQQPYCQGFTTGPNGTCGVLATTNNPDPNTPNVLIVNNSQVGNYQGIPIPFDEVIVKRTPDNKIYTFMPIDPLGSEAEPTNYTVTLTSNLTKVINGQPALPNGFDWSFGIGTYLDNTPPQVTIVFPEAGTTVPKNAMVQINFSEAISPISATGIVEVDQNQALIPGTFQNITIGYDNSTKFVPGTFSIGNQYKTVEFLSDSPCDQGGSGPVINSCGEQVYCLPGDSDFKVTVKAAELNTLLNGIYDAAGNSLDGGGENGQNKNGVSNGPPDDNYWWEFSTNDELDLDPPSLVSLNPVIPAQGVTNIPLNFAVQGISGVKATFDEAISAISVNTTNFILIRDTLECRNQDPVIAQPENGQYPELGSLGCFTNGFYTGLNASTQAVLYTVGNLWGNETSYNPRLVSYIKDLFQNCFCPPQGIPGTTLYPDTCIGF